MSGVAANGPGPANWLTDYTGFWRDSVLKDFIKNAVQVGLGTFIAVVSGVISPSDEQAQALVLVAAILYVPSVVAMSLSAVVSHWNQYLPPSAAASCSFLLIMFGIGLATDTGYLDTIVILGFAPLVVVGFAYALWSGVRAIQRRDWATGRGLLGQSFQVVLLAVGAIGIAYWLGR